MFFTKKQLISLFGVVGMGIAVTVSCGRVPTNVSPGATGSVEIRVQLADGIGKGAAEKKTGFDSLVVVVNGKDMEPVRWACPIDPVQLFLIDTLSGIPTGSEREFCITTINRAGEVIHEDSAGLRTIRVDPNVTTLLQVVMVPVRGSIYLQIGGVPTDVDTIGALFTADDGRQWGTVAPRSPKVFVSIDGIPHATHGILLVAGFTAGGDTLYRARSELRVNARATNEVALSFETTPGGVALTGTLQLPGATAVSGSLGAMEVAGSERGDLVITEIMYAANDSEYIEIYNPKEVGVIFDSLYIDIDGTRRLFTGIQIEAAGYYIFGRQMLPWVDAASPVKSALDLSANGNWVTLRSKEGVVIDQVIFTGGSNDLEWPRISGKASICLQAGHCNCAENNFGRHWWTASTAIEGAPSQMGTPHGL
ncbi:MAG: lamin tail domain-containing protein [Chitinispirillaceae bacterium]|nr:lamin tail domain-containing protein [Chitinispirillaceae bacterium]